MVSSIALAVTALAVVSNAAPRLLVPPAYLAGFTLPVISLSAGGYATCIQGLIPVKVSTTNNVKFNLATPANQTVLTDIWTKYLQINSTYVASISEGPATVSGTFDISAKLCYPVNGNGINSTTLQFATHGVSFDKNYWDFLPGYSFVDVAAQNGYATFVYDRLGSGLSAHPDPLQVVQAPTELQIAHQLIQTLRAGGISSTAFSHIVGVGHSYGSVLTEGLTFSYPKDLDAAVFTGFTSSGTGLPTFEASFDSVIANQANPLAFGLLNNGYMTYQSAVGIQFSYFRAPNFDPAILQATNANKKEYNFGQIWTAFNVVGVATAFTGPVAIVNGGADWGFCQGDCLYPIDQSALALEAFFPARASGSRSMNYPGVGHVLNYHYQGAQAFAYIQNFLKSNGL